MARIGRKEGMGRRAENECIHEWPAVTWRRCVAALALASLLSIVAPPSSMGSSRATATRHMVVPAPPQWRIEKAPSAKGDHLASVSCTARDACMAVGATEEGALAERWDGDSWTRLSAASRGPFSGLSGVACNRTDECLAVGGDGFGYQGSPIAELWDGTRWQREPAPTFNERTTLSGVSCITPNFCLAMGESGDGPGSGTLILKWDGNRWVRQAAPLGYHPAGPNGEPIVALSDVSCASVHSCVAVGGPVVERRRDGSWRLQPAPHPYRAHPHWVAELSDVSCASPSSCLAVGVALGGGEVPDRPFAYRLTGGRWTNELLPAPRRQNSEFSAVSCVSRSYCVAVGSTTGARRRSAPIAEQWNGHSWNVMHVAGAADSRFNAVVCTARSECVAVGGRAGGVLVERLGG